jgi:hypothetical protein
VLRLLLVLLLALHPLRRKRKTRLKCSGTQTDNESVV